MLKTLKILVEMQNFDDQIGEKNILKESLPKQLDKLFTNMDTAKNNYNLVKEEIDKILVTSKKKELEQQSNNQQIDKYENQLLLIKTNKEYKALNSEIKNLKDKNSEIDTQLIELMEAESEMKKELEEKTHELKKAENDIKEQEDAIKNEIKKVDADIESLKEARNKIASQLPVSIIKKYGSLIKHKNRKAVAHITSHKGCSCCGFIIRPQSLIDVNRQDKLIYCENCGRIIIDNGLAIETDKKSKT